MFDTFLDLVSAKGQAQKIYQWDSDEECWEVLGAYVSAIESSTEALCVSDEGKTVLYLLLVCLLFFLLVMCVV